MATGVDCGQKKTRAGRVEGETLTSCVRRRSSFRYPSKRLRPSSLEKPSPALRNSPVAPLTYSRLVQSADIRNLIGAPKRVDNSRIIHARSLQYPVHICQSIYL